MNRPHQIRLDDLFIKYYSSEDLGPATYDLTIKFPGEPRNTVPLVETNDGVPVVGFSSIGYVQEKGVTMTVLTVHSRPFPPSGEDLVGMVMDHPTRTRTVLKAVWGGVKRLRRWRKDRKA